MRMVLFQHTDVSWQIGSDLILFIRAALLIVAFYFVTLQPQARSAGVDFYDGGTNDSFVGASPRSVATGDFNADGKLDLVVANSNGNNVSVLIGTGTGTFAPAANFAVGTSPTSVATDDLNSDGILDLVVANSNSANVSILLGRGSGKFAAATNFAVGNAPFSLALGDFDGNGKTDIAVTNSNDNTVSILLGVGNGSFGVATNFAVTTDPRSIAVGDFNGDGTLDFTVASVSSNNVSVLLGTGTGSFGGASNFAAGMNCQSVATGDFNTDGTLDLVVANHDSNNVSVLLGTRTGGFGTATNFPASLNPFSVVVNDFDSDGILDLTVTNFTSSSVQVLKGTGTGSFGSPNSFAVGSNPVSVTTGDFNRDGKPDLAVANNGSNNVSILLGSGTGNFGTLPLLTTGTNPFSVSVADFDKDGNPDLVTANQNGNSVSVLLGTGQGGFKTATTFGAGTNPYSVTTGDLNADGNPDIITTNLNSNNVSILLGNGIGGFAAATDFAVGTAPVSVAIGDFNGDGHLDLAVANNGSNDLSLLLGTGSGSFSAATNFSVGSEPAFAVTADLNRDGNLDIAITTLGNAGNDNASVLIGTGTGSFLAAQQFAVGSDPYSLAVGDFNNDGKPDLVTANNGNNSLSVMLGTGSGSFNAATNYAVGTLPRSVQVGDLNGDGNLDIAVTNQGSNNVSVLLGTGIGFETAVNFSVGSIPYSIAVSNFNGDGKLDLAIANSGSNSVSVLLNITAEQAIIFASIPNKVFGDPPFSITATATSGLPVIFSIVSGPATLSGNSLTLTGSGQVIVRAAQTGGGSYGAALDVEQFFFVSQASQTISFPSLPGKTFGDSPFLLSATGGASGNPVTFAISGPASIVGNQVTLTGSGLVTVTASQSGSANYQAANSVSRTFAVAKATPVISWTNPADVVSGTVLGATQLNATSSIPGVFQYLPASGTALVRGSIQTLSVIFSPTDYANYNEQRFSVSINVLNAEPLLLSQPAATPNPAKTGSLVSFSAFASDNDNDSLTYAWDFGDGTHGTGATTSHVYNVPSIYMIKLMVTDGNGGVSNATITLPVASPGSIVGALDTDGDGFPDALEIAAGTSASNSADTPVGGDSESNTLPILSAKLSIKLNFAKPSRDSISLTGVLLLPVGFSENGSVLVVDIGGVAKKFTLGPTGAFRDNNNSVIIVARGNTQLAKISMHLTKADFAATLAPLGISGTASVKDVAVNVPVMLVLGKSIFSKNLAQTYTAKAGRSGATKDRK